MKLDSLTIAELLALYVSISEQQYPLVLNGEVRKYNRLMDKYMTVVKELKNRGLSAHKELIKLYDHPNIKVRLNAAKSTLAIAREPALEVLRKITKEDFGEFKLDAGMTIALVEDGTINPT